MEVPQQLRIELPSELAIPLLDNYPKYLKTFICKVICTTMLLAALFLVAKTWKQPKLLDDWIKKTWYINTKEYYPVIRKD